MHEREAEAEAEAEEVAIFVAIRRVVSRVRTQGGGVVGRAREGRGGANRIPGPNALGTRGRGEEIGGFGLGLWGIASPPWGGRERPYPTPYG